MLMKLMKYELIRRKNSLAIFLGVLLTLEIFSLFAIYKGDKWLLVFVIVGFFVIIGASLFVVYDNIKLLSDDLNHSSGYMLFLTPNHGYNITAAKMIIGFIEVAVTFLIVTLIYYLNWLYIDQLYAVSSNVDLKHAFSDLTNMLKMADVTIGHIIYVIFTYVIGWFVFITTVYLAIILRKTLFSNSKFNGLYSFVIFVALNMIVGTAGQFLSLGLIAISRFRELILAEFGPATDPVFFKEFIVYVLNVSNIINLFVVIGFFWACGYLLTKRIDL